MNRTDDGAPTRRRPGRPRKAQAGNTKEELTRAAVRLFSRNGFEGTSIRAIAREVGLSESVLYAHFENKRAIFDAVIARYGPTDSARALDRVDHDLMDVDPSQFLTQLVGAFLDDWDRDDARTLISLVTRDGLLHSESLRTALTGTSEYATALFSTWLGAGWIPEHLGPADRLAYSFTGPIGLARVLHLHADADSAERAQARSDVLRHVELFAAAVFRDHGRRP